MIHRVSGMTWPEIEQRLASGAAALLPIGAGAKEHGLHMPMNTDEIQADWLADQVALQHDLLVWPTVRYGYYPAFRDFPGSISLGVETFKALIKDILTGIAAWKPRAIFVLDTGISTIAPIDAVLSETSLASKVHHLRIYHGSTYGAAARLVSRQQHGSHADELETSRMLVIAPEAVDMTKAQASPPGQIEGPLTRKNAPSGSYGDPALASTAKGEKLIAAMLDDIHWNIATALNA